MDKLKLMLWKNYVVDKRNPVKFSMEIGMSIGSLVWILVLRKTSDIVQHKDTNFPAFAPTDVKTNGQLLVYSPYNKALDGIVNNTATQLQKKVLVFNSSHDMSAFLSHEDNMKKV